MPIKENIEGIELTVPSKWDRDTIADGTWLRNNTINPLYENDKTLASAIASTAGVSPDVVWDYQDSEKRPSFSEIRQTLRTNKRIYVKNYGMVVGYCDTNNRDTPDDECTADLYFYVMELGDPNGFYPPYINVFATNCTELGQIFRGCQYELKQTQKITFAQGYNGTSITDVQRVVEGNEGSVWGGSTHNCVPIFVCDLTLGNTRKALPAIDYKFLRDEHYNRHAYITVYDQEIKSLVTYKWDQPDGGTETRTKEVNRIQEVIPEMPSNITSDYYQEVQSKLSAASANNTPLFADIGIVVPVSWFGYGGGTSTGESGSHLGFSYFDPYMGESKMTTISMEHNSTTDEVTYSKEEKKLKETIRYTWPAEDTMSLEQFEELKKIVRKIKDGDADLIMVVNEDDYDYDYPIEGAWYDSDEDSESLGIYTFPDIDTYVYFNAYKYDSATTIYNTQSFESNTRIGWTRYETDDDGYMQIDRWNENYLLVLWNDTKTSLKFKVHPNRMKLKYTLTNDVDASKFSIVDRYGNEMLMDVNIPALPIFNGYTYIIDIEDGCYSVRGFQERTSVSVQSSPMQRSLMQDAPNQQSEENSTDVSSPAESSTDVSSPEENES